jgi:3-deoxy-D-manno-octulosonic-acid transferase
VYALLMTLLQPALALKLRWRARREPAYGQRMAQRWGRYEAPAEAGPWLWLHAVSLGETRAAAPLLAALRQRCPGLRVVLTHSTATGWEAGQALLAPGDRQVWAPWDAPAAVAGFFEHWSPRVGLLMETEVWPGWMREAQRRGVPMVLVNARLSARSAQRLSRWPQLMRPAYAALSQALAQSAEDAQRLQDAGVSRCAVVGNLKYDMPVDTQRLALGRRWRQGLGRPVAVLASSREGEEQAWVDAMGQPQATALQWLIVPRHPQRVEAVVQLLARAGWGVQRRSTWPEEGPPPTQGPTVWLGDSLGEMALYYGLSDVALLGGSFAPLGGQNLIEAMACDCPVITGPSLFNFAQAAQDLQGQALATVADLPAAVALAQAWAHAPDAAARRAAGAAQVAQHAGAVAATVRALAPQLDQMGGPGHVD